MALDAPRRNVELKARDASPAASLRACQTLPAEDQGEIWQRDTYFNVTYGRLKLREQRPDGAQLIHYERRDDRGQRESRYRIAPVDAPAELAGVLEAAMGVAATVVKRRRLFLWRTVRIHLDQVEDLGTFVELEAVAPPGSDLRHEHELLQNLRVALSISDADLMTSGYADQVLAGRRRA